LDTSSVQPILFYGASGFERWRPRSRLCKSRGRVRVGST